MNCIQLICSPAEPRAQSRPQFDSTLLIAASHLPRDSVRRAGPLPQREKLRVRKLHLESRRRGERRGNAERRVRRQARERERRRRHDRNGPALAVPASIASMRGTSASGASRRLVLTRRNDAQAGAFVRLDSLQRRRRHGLGLEDGASTGGAAAASGIGVALPPMACWSETGSRRFVDGRVRGDLWGRRRFELMCSISACENVCIWK